MYPGSGTAGGSSAARNMLQRKWRNDKKSIRLSYRQGITQISMVEQHVDDYVLSMGEFEKGVEMLAEEAYMLG